MTDADLSRIHDLECASQRDPWNLQHFVDELHNPVATLDLYWRKDVLAGFLCTWLIAGEMQIQNLATSPALRRSGIAGCLLGHAIARAKGQGLQAVFLEVRAGNLPAIRLYERYGFTPAGTRRGYYPDGEDALLMTYHVDAQTDVRHPV